MSFFSTLKVNIINPIQRAFGEDLFVQYFLKTLNQDSMLILDVTYQKVVP